MKLKEPSSTRPPVASSTVATILCATKLRNQSVWTVTTTAMPTRRMRPSREPPMINAILRPRLIGMPLV